MKIARIWVTTELLREALHLPADTDILNCRAVPDIMHTLEFVLQSDSLQDVALAPGEEPPLASPTFERQEPVRFVGWGQG